MRKRKQVGKEREGGGQKGELEKRKRKGKKDGRRKKSK